METVLITKGNAYPFLKPKRASIGVQEKGNNAVNCSKTGLNQKLAFMNENVADIVLGCPRLLPPFQPSTNRDV